MKLSILIVTILSGFALFGEGWGGGQGEDDGWGSGSAILNLDEQCADAEGIIGECAEGLNCKYVLDDYGICKEDEWCDFESSDFFGQCEMLTSQENGSWQCEANICIWKAEESGVECDKKDIMCPMIYSPVCGVDGKTYGNLCVAQSNCVEVAHSGKCK